MTTDLADGLLRYFAIREQQRADAVAAALGGLTDREQALMREAAVMGYVHGLRRGSCVDLDTPVPPDSVIVAEVVDACLHLPGLYPTIAGRGTGR